MASSHNAPASQPETAAERRASPILPDWLNAAMVLLTVIAGLGLLVGVTGAYLVKSDWLLLISAIIVTAAGVGWGIAAVLLIYSVTKLRISGSGKGRKASPPATPE